jgi:hypothetical protein
MAQRKGAASPPQPRSARQEAKAMTIVRIGTGAKKARLGQENQRCAMASHTASARAKGMTDEQFAELLAVTGLANETNRLAISVNDFS